MTEETTAMLTKKGLRASLLARRKQLFESLALDNGLAERFLEMLELARPKSVGLFWPIRSEPGLLSVARDWLKRTGGLIYLPETRPDCMIYRLWHEGAELRKDCAGIPYPQGEEASKPPAMVVAPCVGYAESCRRLGYGGGYFDRYLASWPLWWPCSWMWPFGRALSHRRLWDCWARRLCCPWNPPEPMSCLRNTPPASWQPCRKSTCQSPSSALLRWRLPSASSWQARTAFRRYTAGGTAPTGIPTPPPAPWGLPPQRKNRWSRRRWGATPAPAYWSGLCRWCRSRCPLSGPTMWKTH